MTHAELVEIAGKWLKRQGCNVVLLERFAGNDHRGECPDAIGWWCSGFTSTVVECKVSLDDFIADQRKPWRVGPAMGSQRWYLAPKGLLMAPIIPRHWGLLEWTGRVVRKVVMPELHVEGCPEHSRDTDAEAKLLLAELRIYHAQGIHYRKFAASGGYQDADASPTTTETLPSSDARICPQDGGVCWGSCDVAACQRLADGEECDGSGDQCCCLKCSTGRSASAIQHSQIAPPEDEQTDQARGSCDADQRVGDRGRS